MELHRAVPLAPRTTLGVGGPAQWFVEVRDLDSLRSALDWAHRSSLPVALLGGGSNLLVADGGVSGLVIAIGLRGLESHAEGDSVLLRAAAGEPWDEVVAHSVAAGYAGLECLSGIPGSTGATPVQNVGAYGREVGELIERVELLDRRDLSLHERSPSELAFGYRRSALKDDAEGRYIVVSVSYRLRRGGPPLIRYPELARQFAALGHTQPTPTEVRAAVLALRRAKSMLFAPSDPNTRSCGSFFVNPLLTPAELTLVNSRVPAEVGPAPCYPQLDGRVKVPAAWLIEQAGLVRGTQDGKVGLSPHHALAIVAAPGATAADVVRFAWRVRRAVQDRFAVRLEPEPIAWGFAALEAGLPLLGDT